MSDTVFLFGAGASAESGAPVMANFLDVARGIVSRGAAGPAQASFTKVFQGIAALSECYAKAVIDTDNLEAVFAAFEMGEIFGKLPRALDPAELGDCLRDVIIETLQQTIGFHISSRSVPYVNIDPPEGYGELLSLLQPERAASRTFMTFNYDLALDFAFRHRDEATPIDYGIQAQRAIGQRPLLLKLHGSHNWTACGNCGIAIYDPHTHIKGDVSRDYRVRPPFVEVDQKLRLNIASQLRSFPHCNDTSKSTGMPLLVPPTPSKREHHRQIKAVWQHAARELASARNIIVIGYSLPETDEFFRYLYALGTVSDTRIERFWVVDSDTSERLTNRFRSLLGPTALVRFKRIPMRFSGALRSAPVNDREPYEASWLVRREVMREARSRSHRSDA
jgi:hypothetical protein